MAETKTDAKASRGVVVKAKKQGHVGLWEVNAEHKEHGHKDGEIFVKDDPVRVALTPGVAAAIKAVNLVETDEKPVESEKKAAPSK
jgi:hypothetical protein